MKHFPAVLVTGPRQVGKSTLLQNFAPNYTYVTFDDPIVRTMATDDPQLFLQNYPGPLIIDEVQYVPSIFPVLKMRLDQDKTPGQLLLTGSQSFPLMNGVAESLAGRVAVLNLPGFSMREIVGVDFCDPFIPTANYLDERQQDLRDYGSLAQRLHRGNMPALNVTDTDWNLFYMSYVSTYIQRDVREVSRAVNLVDFTRFLVALAGRSGELLNYSSLATDAQISLRQAKDWLAILQASGIVYLLQPWSQNHLKRGIKTPKVYFLDTGLMAYLTRWLTPQSLWSGAKVGQFFETFVVSQIVMSFMNSAQEPPLYFFRDSNGVEIDVLVEANDSLFPVEIKLSAKPHRKMAKALSAIDGLEPGVLITTYPSRLQVTENAVSVPPSFI